MRADLVTGATGFIGRHLAERLHREGRKIKLLCRPQSVEKLPLAPGDTVDVVFGDLCDRSSIDKAMEGVERAFHCAGHVSDWGANDAFYSVNVRGTQWLLDAALDHKVARFIHLSSYTVFGVPSPRCFDDDTPYGHGKDHYSRTKIEGEILALRYHREYGLPVVVLRPGIVYGPHSIWVEEPVALMRRGLFFLIAGGKGTCHPCHVDNLTDAMLLSAEHPKAVGNAYIVADDHPVPYRDYFSRLARAAGAGPVRRSIPLPLARAVASVLEFLGNSRHSTMRPLLTHMTIDMLATRSDLCMDKIRRELGFEPKLTFDRGMDLLGQWMGEKNRGEGSAGRPAEECPERYKALNKSSDAG